MCTSLGTQEDLLWVKWNFRESKKKKKNSKKTLGYRPKEKKYIEKNYRIFGI